MCFTVSIFSNSHVVETSTGALFENVEEYQPYFHVSGFVHPVLPLVVNDHPKQLTMASWGLVPRWIATADDAVSYARNTLNARSETIFEKPSYRSAIRSRRALLPVDGFVEWRQDGRYKQPYFIRRANQEPMTLAAIWEDWIEKETGVVSRSFSIVTTRANTLLSFIHNNKQRMPVVITSAAREQWLLNDDSESIHNLLCPLADGDLEAFAVSTDLSKVKVNRHQSELLAPVGEVIR